MKNKPMPHRKINVVFVISLLMIALIGTMFGSCVPVIHKNTSVDVQHQPDTVANRFTNAEKTAGVLFVVFAVYATSNAKD